MKAALGILAALVVCALSKKMGEDCMKDMDCDDGCCMKMMDGGMRCHMMAIMGEKCDRLSMAEDVCMCMGDMMCMGEPNMDPRYGMCMMKMTST